ncbi:MAG: GAF domain-containing sensor histidine kinase [Anaerolineae bacterium]|nr:GAF domain-containing sensor histidine kinase [Anaerolineae bacterium]
MTSDTLDEANLASYIDLLDQLTRGEYQLDALDEPTDQLGQAVFRLARALAKQQQERRLIEHITAQINAGLLLDDILDLLYDDLRELIPYARIGLSLVDEAGETVTLRWVKSDRAVQLGDAYSAPLASSSLKTILETGQPRILNDLEAYLQAKPESHATQLLVAEGMRSSMTCPLVIEGAPVGFLFFSSTEPYTYQAAHIDVFKQIAAQLSVIIEKGRLVSQLAAQKVRLEEINEAKNTFVGVAAHDLRSPLSIIEMATSLFDEPGFTLSQAELETIMTNIAVQTRHMRHLIDNLLDFSRIERDKIEFMPKLVDLHEFLTKTVKEHTPIAEAKGSTLVLNSELDASDIIKADPMRLRQIADNLISNAIKFSPLGSKIEVIGKRIDSGWRIEVVDAGPGLSPDDQAQLFQPFKRLSAQPTGGERSTGLGLAITRPLVEAHHGEIGVETALGAGSRFWFTLPTAGLDADS